MISDRALLIQMAYNFKQGKFVPRFPEKWVNPTGIVYRSGLERKYFRYLESRKEVVAIASEEFYIPYISPVDNKEHRYFVDLIVKTSNGQTWVVEIKPESQTIAPKKTKRKKESTFLQEAITYEINSAKWKAAEMFCRKHGYVFLIATEKDLNKVKD